MPWNTPNSGFTSGSPITPAWMNGIGLDLRTWGGNVDAGNNSLVDVAAIGLNVQTLPGTAFNITAASWSGGIATVTIGSHNIAVNQVFTVASVTPTGYNVANVQSTSVTSTTVSYALTANPGTWTSGGTLTVFAPALGWIAVNPAGVIQYYNGSSWVTPTGSAGAGYYATSNTSLSSTASGTTSVISNQSNLAYATGMNVVLINTANTAQRLYGSILSYSGNTFSINVTSTTSTFSGVTTWVIGLVGDTGATGSTGATGPGYIGTSATSFTPGSGSFPFTTQTGLAFAVNSYAIAISSGSGAFIEGQITSYTGTTLTIDCVGNFSGMGAHTDWVFSISGPPGTPGTNGTNGTNGIGYNPRGAWVSGGTYAQGDLVSDVSLNYINVVPVSGSSTHPASDATHWEPYNSGLSDPGTNGIMKRTALNVTTQAIADDFASPVYAACASASGTTYTATLSPAITAYTTGTHYIIQADVANTGVATMNLNGIGAKSITKPQGGITTALVANDIQAGQILELVYDGTELQLTSQLGNAPSSSYNGPSVQAVANPWLGTPTTSRALGTVYHNTSSTKPLFVVVSVEFTSGTNAIAYTDSSSSPTTEVGTIYGGTSGTEQIQLTFWVLPNNYYEVINGSALVKWAEWQ